MVRITHWPNSIEHNHETLVLDPWRREASNRWNLFHYEHARLGVTVEWDAQVQGVESASHNLYSNSVHILILYGASTWPRKKST
jgi:hypothetical protein